MLRIIVLFALTFSLAQAAAIPCVPGTLVDYMALSDGCSVGDAVVSDFALGPLSAGSTEIDPSSVTLNPLTGDLPGLRLTYGASASPGQVLQSIFGFVLTFPSSSLLGQATLRSLGTTVGDGAAVVITTEFCRDDFLSGCGSPVAGVFDIGSDSETFSRITLPAATFFTVQHDAVIDGTFAAASLDSAELRFAQIPEPATAGSCITALAAFAGFLCRRRKPF